MCVSVLGFVHYLLTQAIVSGTAGAFKSKDPRHRRYTLFISYFEPNTQSTLHTSAKVVTGLLVQATRMVAERVL